MLNQKPVCYDMLIHAAQVEDKTPFARWYEPRAAPLPSDESAADMFRLASSLLHGAGFEHYEISSYARAGRRYAHAMACAQGHNLAMLSSALFCITAAAHYFLLLHVNPRSCHASPS